ncbi:MAG TPA: branched-chain amino acid ABC transporter permease [Candidatus Nitrosotalea sp.]|nr:branched-chain amino acid ABC transporter permease [Candidatus Nitrosotalea sp.]
MINTILESVGFGMVTASILALATVAVGLQFSVTNIPNFAAGDIMTAGAFAAYAVGFVINNAVIQALAAIVVGAIIAYLLNKGLLQPFKRAGARNIMLVIITLSASLILQNIMLAIFGGSEVFYKFPNSAPHHFGPFLLTTNSLLIMGTAVVAIVGVHSILHYTRLGKAQRAVSDDVDLARVTGIDSNRIIDLTWLWSGGMAGFAGFVLALEVGAFTNTLGFTYLFIIFAASVVGGIGNIYGALLGSLLIGLGMEVSAIWVSGDYKQTFALVVLIVTLLFRPSGIFPSRIRNVVQAV